MAKQFLLISLAMLTFIAVWGVVILKLGPTNSDSRLAFHSSEPSVEMTMSERVMSLPDSITEQESDEPLERVEAETVKDNKERKAAEGGQEHEQNTQGENRKSSPYINLRDYDFSDISTSEGVPIDGILEKLDIE
ncbi:hypothetical protein [Halalkalibacter urbisdiaboli]|uniref:hypothetical protein n=1 Tax=Halalkalibacter urbisdiaboli TaxID=1960589 RepID=UPI000B4330FC|nr:hypothetical protein [Halalkalibacter urbisdiaboli]